MKAKATLTIGVTLVVFVISAILFSIKGKDSSQVTVRGDKAGDIERFFTEVLPKSADWGDKISHHSLQPIRTSGTEYAVKILREHSKKSLLGSCMKTKWSEAFPQVLRMKFSFQELGSPITGGTSEKDSYIMSFCTLNCHLEELS